MYSLFMHIYVRSVIVYKVEDHISDKACTINLQTP